MISVIVLGILILALFTTLLKSSETGPGSMHAPVILALIGGLVFGAFAQKSRMCFAGSIRDIILMKNFDLFCVIAGLFVVMLVFNVATGRFVLAFDTPESSLIPSICGTSLACIRWALPQYWPEDARSVS